MGTTNTKLDRPAVLTKEAQHVIVEALARGHWLGSACKLARTTRQNWHYWYNLYKSGAEHAQVYADFFDACERADAEAQDLALPLILAGAQGWQGPAFFLERRWPKLWGRKDMVTVKGVPRDLSKCTDEELDAIERGLGRKGSR